MLLQHSGKRITQCRHAHLLPPPTRDRTDYVTTCETRRDRYLVFFGLRGRLLRTCIAPPSRYLSNTSTIRSASSLTSLRVISLAGSSSKMPESGTLMLICCPVWLFVNTTSYPERVLVMPVPGGGRKCRMPVSSFTKNKEWQEKRRLLA